MQSFGAPRSTTNPYIHMLDAALAETDGLEHLRFDRRTALTGSWDAIHFHWPESLLGGSTRVKALARRLVFAALLARIRRRGIAVVRTMHNVELPTGVTPWELRMLEEVERLTDFRILLNDLTPVADGTPSAVIPHGDFRTWFAQHGVLPADPEPDTIAFVGLVRRYKGVEPLIAAFRDTADTAPQLRLRISGNPTSEELAAEVRASAAVDPRIALDLRFLSELEFGTAMSGSEGVVLPYRFMHNSGAVLAALSLDRPVLVPRNDVNEALSDEVGPGWIQMFDDELTADDLARFLPLSRASRTGASPNLSRRTWERVGADHLAAYTAAVAARGGRSR